VPASLVFRFAGIAVLRPECRNTSEAEYRKTATPSEGENAEDVAERAQPLADATARDLDLSNATSAL